VSDLHYDVQGSGPVLLVIPGGAGHPMGLGPLTESGPQACERRSGRDRCPGRRLVCPRRGLHDRGLRARPHLHHGEPVGQVLVCVRRLQQRARVDAYGEAAAPNGTLRVAWPAADGVHVTR
jgi:hypothetical protein